MRPRVCGEPQRKNFNWITQIAPLQLKLSQTTMCARSGKLKIHFVVWEGGLAAFPLSMFTGLTRLRRRYGRSR